MLHLHLWWYYFLRSFALFRSSRTVWCYLYLLFSCLVLTYLMIRQVAVQMSEKYISSKVQIQFSRQGEAWNGNAVKLHERFIVDQRSTLACRDDDCVFSLQNVQPLNSLKPALFLYQSQFLRSNNAVAPLQHWKPIYLQSFKCFKSFKGGRTVNGAPVQKRKVQVTANDQK